MYSPRCLRGRAWGWRASHAAWLVAVMALLSRPHCSPQRSLQQTFEPRGWREPRARVISPANEVSYTPLHLKNNKNHPSPDPRPPLQMGDPVSAAVLQREQEGRSSSRTGNRAGRTRLSGCTLPGPVSPKLENRALFFVFHLPLPACLG